MSDKTAIHRATGELTALALAVRTDWREADVSGVIARAAQDGMTWEQVLVSLPRLMIDPASHPRELVPDSRNPLAPARSVPADAVAEWAQARAEMQRERATRSVKGADVA